MPALSMQRTPFADARSRFLAGRFGMWLLLASLGMLFASTLVIFLVLRLQIGAAHAWPELPPLPRVLWLSTLLIIASSGTMQWALASIRRGDASSLKVGMTLTMALGVAFLILQAIAWSQWFAPAMERWANSDEYRFALSCFYVFTGLHAAHVVGGLVPLACVTARAWRDRHTAAEHAGVLYGAMYWHFLDVVWLALFATLMIGV